MVSSDMDGSDIGRERGMFTEADRKWLITPKEEFIQEHSPQYWGQRRDDFAERLVHTLLDFRLLAANYDEHTDRVFREADDSLVEGMIGMIAVLYRGVHPMVQYHSAYTRFEDLLKRGVALAVAESRDDIPDPRNVRVRFEDDSIEFELREGAIDLEYIGEKIAAGETSDLDREQLEWFIDYYQRSGELDPEVPAEHELREWDAAQRRREKREDDNDE